MENENAIFNLEDEEFLDDDLEETFDLEEFESEVNDELETGLSDLRFLEEEKEKIGSPDNLGKVIGDVVWEQFINQISDTAGEDFIKENNGLRLDLRNEAHIQTAENFSEGKLATHNHISREQLEKNYDRYVNMSHKEFRKEYVNPGMDATLKRAGDLKKEGVDTVKDIYTGRQIPTDTKMKDGTNNPNAAQREHVIPSAEYYRDPSMQMANSSEELAKKINDPNNLQGYTTADRNNRKSDKSPEEMSEKDKTGHFDKAHEKAEEHYQKTKKEGEDRLKKEGRQTQKEEAFRMGGKALRAAVMQLLLDFVKEAISKMVKWFKSAKRTLRTLIDSLKEAVHSFFGKLKTNLINAGNTVASAVATAVFGPIVGVIKKAWLMLKEAGKNFTEAFKYLRDPANKGKPIGILVMEVGKILIGGITTVGAIALGETIEKALMIFPVFAVQIPLIGSLASVLGIFFGAVVSGIIGAIAINCIEKKIEKKLKSENVNARIEKENEILNLQKKALAVSGVRLEQTKYSTAQNMYDRHTEAAKTMLEASERIEKNCTQDESIKNNLDSIDLLLAKLGE